MADWIKFFGLSDDPFSISPISDRSELELFHVTNDIEMQVIPFVNIMATSRPRIKLIVSDRGMGKTSLLRFIQWRSENEGVVAFHVKAFESLEPGKTHVDLARGVISELLSEMLQHIVANRPEVYQKYRAVVDHKLDLLGKTLVDGRMFTVSDVNIPLAAVASPIKDILQIFRAERIRFAVYLDNLDKYDAPDTLKVVFELLRMPVSQSTFETIVDNGGFVFLTLATPLYERMTTEGKGDFSYLDDPFRLSALRPGEAFPLLRTRFGARSAREFPIEPDGVAEIVSLSGGNVRRILQRARRVLEYAAEQKSVRVAPRDVVRALRSIEKFDHFMRQAADIPAMKSGFRFISSILARGVELRRVQLLVKAAYRATRGRRLAPPERQILEEFSYGGRPLQASATGYEINDQNLLDFLKFLEDEGLDVEDFLAWLLGGKAIPEFLLETRSPEEHLGRLILVGLDSWPTPSRNRARVIQRGRTLTYAGAPLVAQIKQHLTVGLERLQAWETGALDELSGVEKIRELTTGIVPFYRAFALFLAAQKDLAIDLDSGVVDSLLRIIFGAPNPNSRQMATEADARALLKAHFEAGRGQSEPLPYEVTDAIRKTHRVLLEILRFWQEALPQSNRRLKVQISGETNVARAIDTALSISPHRLALLTVPGQTLRDFSLYFWPGDYSYWGYANVGVQSQAIAKEVVRTTSRMGNIGKGLRLGSVWFDTNALVGGVISKNADLGIYERARIVVPSVVRYEYEFTDSNKLKSACMRDVSYASAHQGKSVGRLEIQDSADSGLEVTRDGKPGAEKGLGSKIDSQLVRRATAANAFLASSDTDLLAHARSTTKLLLVPPDGQLQPFAIGSLQSMLGDLLKNAPQVQIRVFGGTPSLDTDFLLSTVRGVFAAEQIVGPHVDDN